MSSNRTMKTFCLRLVHFFPLVMLISSESWTDPSVYKTVIQGGPQDEYIVNMTNPEMIRSHGYSCEIHHVNVSNYRLEMHRIPKGLNQSNPSKGNAALFIHGFSSSANIFSVGGPKSALSYILADSGYDVWLANVRGNHYSRFHYNISTEDPAFWKFSWDEHIGGDLANMIDYILNLTGTSKLYLVGHSSGNLISTGLLASQVEYNNKVKAVITLGALNIDYVWQEMIPLLGGIANLIWRIIPDGQYGEESTLDNYKNESFNFFQLESGGDKPSGFDLKSLKVSLAKSESSSAWRVIKHSIQFGVHGFRKYDYGVIQNLKIYKMPSPPKYNLTNISAPVYIYAAANDKAAGKTQSLSLCDSIPSCKAVLAVGSWYSGHSWLWLGNDAKTALFPMVLSAMNKEEQNDDV